MNDVERYVLRTFGIQEDCLHSTEDDMGTEYDFRVDPVRFDVGTDRHGNPKIEVNSFHCGCVVMFSKGNTYNDMLDEYLSA